ncbi:MAG: DUF4031 domain-containing protein [Ornithinimicrobium sp.]
MTIWVDPPTWPAHGRLWSHVISDTSLEELHAFAVAAGIPDRSFEGDHYDIPEHRHTDVVAAGAIPVSGRDVARKLAASGLRFRKRKGERPLGRYPDGLAAVGGPHTLDVIASPREPIAEAGAAVVLICDESRIVLVRNESRPGWAPPGGKREAGESIRETAVREAHEETSLVLAPFDLVPVGYERITIAPGAARGIWRDGDNHLAVLGVQLRQPAPVRTMSPDVLEAAWFDVDQVHRLCATQPWWPLVVIWLERLRIAPAP